MKTLRQELTSLWHAKDIRRTEPNYEALLFGNQTETETSYLDHLVDLLEVGDFKRNRTGIDTYSLFGHQLRCNLDEEKGYGFPLLTTKKIFLKGIIHELLWFLKGETNIKYLVDNNVHIWDEWADENGDLGPVYGSQWRSWPGSGGKIDQIAGVIETLKTNPDSRRMIVSAWNPDEVDHMALPPCHTLFQFYTHVRDGERLLSCHLYQRSADWFLGVPFNIASYALLTMMVAKVVGMKPYEFVHSFGDTHLYVNHIKQAELQTSRDPRPLPELKINYHGQAIDEFVYEDFELTEYEPYPAIKAEVAV